MLDRPSVNRQRHQRAATEGRCRTVYSLLDYCTIVAVSATTDTGAHVGRGAVLTDCLLLAARPLAGRSCSVTLEPAQLSRQPTLDTANVCL